MSLTSVNNVKAYAGITGSTDDSLLASLVLSCDEAVKSLLLGRVLESANYTEVYDGSGREELVLKQRPVTAITEVKFDSDWGFGDDIEAETLADFQADSGTGIAYWRNGKWPRGRRNVRVKYTAGYATLPKDVVQAANIIVADWYVRAKQLAAGQSQNEIASENTGDRSQSYHKEATEWGIPSQARDYLIMYAPAL
jgi:hypothetical protein